MVSTVLLLYKVYFVLQCLLIKYMQGCVKDPLK
jgi:hypothetical protein